MNNSILSLPRTINRPCLDRPEIIDYADQLAYQFKEWDDVPSFLKLEFVSLIIPAFYKNVGSMWEFMADNELMHNLMIKMFFEQTNDAQQDFISSLSKLAIQMFDTDMLDIFTFCKERATCGY